jgi:hypothetical protein
VSERPRGVKRMLMSAGEAGGTWVKVRGIWDVHWAKAALGEG